MCGAIPPLQYIFMAWHLVKHRDNFTFTLAISDGQKDRMVHGKLLYKINK
jgi:hypothetical protein